MICITYKGYLYLYNTRKWWKLATSGKKLKIVSRYLRNTKSLSITKDEIDICNCVTAGFGSP